jgi:hypothetical protein
MTRGIDNDEWLKNIGAVTVHDDDDRDGTFSTYNGARSAPPSADEEPQPDPADDSASERQSADFDDDGDGEESPLSYAEDDYDGPVLLGSPFDVVGPFDAGGAVVDLDSTSSDAAAIASQDSSPRRYTPWVVAALGAAAVLGTIITLVVTMANSPNVEPFKPASAPVAPRVVEVAPPSPPPNTDGPLPFTASSDCPPGSTSAQSVADPSSTTPWVCVRSVDGQVLEIDLGRTFVITAVSIVPGAVNKTEASPDQPDPWLQHRVVTRVQWQFNDTDRTVKNQNTGNVRGEAVESIRPGVLASKITLIIQETSRPPAIAPTNSPAAPPPGSGPSILGDILGGNQGAAPTPVPVFPGGSTPRDPADGTFAVSSIKIIGHKAV